jgi:hypothetical protein
MSNPVAYNCQVLLLGHLERLTRHVAVLQTDASAGRP